ncbi:hypothetical protein IHE45_06G030700 [Dioscorea alata]|uniref:Uncharacterized protein n=1 Tax=Dioscorea alata TaxID=55571 RepID=A0ACB7VW75_DIOAL|nr:hypothetical protein IHE45_06G030700 [Dioscorea alata]
MKSLLMEEFPEDFLGLHHIHACYQIKFQPPCLLSLFLACFISLDFHCFSTWDSKRGALPEHCSNGNKAGEDLIVAKFSANLEDLFREWTWISFLGLKLIPGK